MESNNSIEELIIRYLQNEIQEDELRVLDAWIHESDANKAHFFELKGLFDTRKEVAFLNHYSVERSWERMAGKLDAISGVSVKSKVLGKQFWLSFLRYAAIIVIAMGVGVGMNQWISNRLYAGDMEYNEIVVEKGGRANTLLLSDGSKIILNASTRFKYAGTNPWTFSTGCAKKPNLPRIIPLGRFTSSSSDTSAFVKIDSI